MDFCVAILILKWKNYATFSRIILCYIKKYKKQLKCKKICAVYEEGAVTDGMRQKWLTEFCAGDVSLDHAPHLGKPVEVDSDQIETLRTISIIPCGRLLTFSKYQNQ